MNNKLNYFTEYWESPNKTRNLEVIDCINKNIQLNIFDSIIIFSSKQEPRIKTNIHISDRVTYQNVFNMSMTGINVLCNADISFDESIKLVDDMDEDEFYALTRYEDDGKLHKHNDPYRGWDSQDVWIWKNRCKITNSNFYIGIPGCDNKIAYDAEQSGYRIKNPSLSIMCKHNHKTNIRPGSSCDLSQRLPPPYRLVPICSIKD